MSLKNRQSSRGLAVCVGGVPGVGKTTLLSCHVTSEPRDMQVTGSSIVKRIIAPATVNELDGWSPDRRQMVREQSIRELMTLRGQCHGRMLIDGHFTLRNRATGVLEPIFTSEDKDFFNALILIHAQPDSVLAQRGRDGRNRSVESVEDVVAHIEFELQEGRRLARDMGVPLLELTECGLPQRLRAMAEFLDDVAPLEVL